MAPGSETYRIYLGYDDRESVAADVAAFSIAKRTKSKLEFHYIKHREMRKRGLFQRPWLIEGSTGQYRDLLDDRPFSTQFSHTRFLVPELNQFVGWALFIDCDMLFQSDVKKLFEMRDRSKAVMCVKHNHTVDPKLPKMDDRAQLNYRRKNWSSFTMWNCEHSLNRKLTREKINYMRGADLHAFSWLKDDDIGSLPFSYNYISGVSPSPRLMQDCGMTIDCVHYTEGGPWFHNCKTVPFADLWDDEYRAWVDAGSPTYDGITRELVVA